MQLSDEAFIRLSSHQLSRVLAHERVRLTNGAFRYVVGVLAHPITDAAFRGGELQAVLADRYCRALATEEPERSYLLSRVGDATVLICSRWWQQMMPDGSRLDLTYPRRLGRTAYGRITGDPFRELTDQFARLTDAVMLLSTRFGNDRDANVLRLYRRWDEDRDAIAGRALRKAGIPVISGSVPS